MRRPRSSEFRRARGPASDLHRAHEEPVLVTALVVTVVEVRERHAFGNGLDPLVVRQALRQGERDGRAPLLPREQSDAGGHPLDALDGQLSARSHANDGQAPRFPAATRKRRRPHLAGLAVEFPAREGRAELAAGRLVEMRRLAAVVLERGHRQQIRLDLVCLIRGDREMGFVGRRHQRGLIPELTRVDSANGARRTNAVRFSAIGSDHPVCRNAQLK